MNFELGLIVLCFSFLYLIEGIDIALHKKCNFAYKITHIIYPLIMVLIMLYLLKCF